MRRRTLLAAIGGLALLAGAAWFYQPLAFLMVWAVGFSPACPPREAFLSFYRKHARQRELASRIAAGTRLIKRDQAGLEFWQTPEGSAWVPAGSEAMLRMLLEQQERKMYGEGRHGVRPGDVVLDCGAHIGFFARQALAAGARLVVAIEPAPENLECLRRNLASELAAGRVLLCEKGVWDKEDLLALRAVPGFSASDSLVPAPASANSGPWIPVTTIDNLVRELRLERVDFIKMNIEGAEQRALIGAAGVLARFKPRMAISTIHKHDDAEKIPLLVRRAWHGYHVDCGACFVDRRHLTIVPEALYFF
jgi:FkbM family methyltransferase